MLVSDHGKCQLLGQTLDDAAGEAFDKVAQSLGLPYPGGPSVAKAAKKGNPHALKLPKAKLDNPYDFSFSGLKTAVLRAAQEICGQDYTFPSSDLAKLLTPSQVADIAASFQFTAVETLVEALTLAAAEFKPKSVAIGGGVAANLELRQQIKQRFPTLYPERGRGAVFYPDIKLCTDNAAMIATAAFFKGKISLADPFSLVPDPGLSM